MAQSRTPEAPTEKPAPKSATAAAFWALMQRWGVLDDQALHLIDQPPSKSGKRPRFSLSADQAERLQLLREIDQQAIDLYHRTPATGCGGLTACEPRSG